MSRDSLKVGDAFVYADCPGHRDHYGIVVAPERALLFQPMTDGTNKAAVEGPIPRGAVAVVVYIGMRGIPEEVPYATLAIRVALGLAPK